MDSNEQNTGQQGAQGSSQAADQVAQGSLEGTVRTGDDLADTLARGTSVGDGVAVGQGADGGGQTQAQGEQAKTSAGSAPRTGVLRPPVDVIEDAQGITLMADMPGVSKDNLNLRLDSQNLTIEGTMQLDGPQQVNSRYAEIRHQHYERTFALSRELDGEKAVAELAQGVLTIRIPKTAHAAPRKIPVNVASA